MTQTVATAADPAIERATERWFIRRGLPMFVENYSASEDVFTRAFWLLVVVFLGAVALTFRSSLDGGAQVAATLGAFALLVGAFVVTNVVRGRRPFERPRRIGPVEIAVFLVVPPLVVLVVGSWQGALVMLGVTVTTLLVVYVVTRYALVAAMAWAFGRVRAQLGDVVRLVTRALPLLLLFITFLFINTEVWQVAGSMEAPVLWLAIAFFATLGVLFLLARLPEEEARVEAEATRDFVLTSCAGTPMQGRADSLPDLDVPVPLAVRQERNLRLVLLFTQLVQVTLLAAAVWAFFVAFGSVAIDTTVQESWLGAPPDVLVELWDDHAVTRELLRVATFLGAFAGLYFTVYAVTDTNYRQQFFDEIVGELGRVVGVRRAYLSLRRVREGDGAAQVPR